MNPLVQKHVTNFFRDITSMGGIWVYLLFSLFIYLLVGKEVAQELVLTLVVTYVIAVLVRLVYFKERPSHEQHTTLLQRIDASAFPSIHAARASGAAFLIAVFLPQVKVLGVCVAVLICLSRVYLRKHDWIDVGVGALMGVGVAYGVYVFV